MNHNRLQVSKLDAAAMEKAHEADKASFTPQTPELATEHDSPPPSYSATIQMKAAQVKWTYDAARGFWVSLEFPGCRAVGFGNDDTDIPHPEFFVVCTLEPWRHYGPADAELALNPERIRHIQDQSKSFMKAAEGLARHRRRNKCDCDFALGTPRHEWEVAEKVPSSGGPTHVSRHPRYKCSGSFNLWEMMKLDWISVQHNALCRDQCFEHARIPRRASGRPE